MAAITDLTFQQLLDALPANSVVLTGGKVMLDPGVITGDSYDTLSDAGVLKVFHKLLNAAAVAQATANTGQATGERLQALGNATYGTISNGFAPVTRQIVTRVNVNSSLEITGQIG